MENVQHGGALDRAIAAYGGKREEWLDLSTGINPNPYPVPEVPKDLWHRLPDENLMKDCLAAARRYYEVSGDSAIVAAPGTQALIQLLPQVTQAKKVWIVGPTYNEYERVFGLSADVIVSTELPEAAGDIDLIVVGCPNNPDGRICDYEQVMALGKSIQKRGGFVLIDAAFGDVLSKDQILPVAASDGDGIVVFRSFGKFFGLAGLRLGFAIGPESIVDRFRVMLGPWAVSGPALFVGAEALRDRDWIDSAKSELESKRSRLESVLLTAGLDKVGSTDLFVTGSQSESGSLAKSLAQNRILVRSFEYNSAWIRFGLPADNAGFERLEMALAKSR